MATRRSPLTQAGIEADPQTLRAQMAETRARLDDSLVALKKTLFENQGKTNEGGKKGMPTKNSGKKAGATAKHAAHKKTGATAKRAPNKKAGAKQASASRAGKARTAKKTRTLATKAKKVLGNVLAGAAVGAVTGAIDAVSPTEPQEGKNEQR